MTEHDPVEDSEFVYRRIPGIYYDSTLTMPVQRDAFRPNANDVSGLSVVRARFAVPSDLLVNLDPDRPKAYYIARLVVRKLKELGLSVEADPLPNGPRGHALIPELSWPTYHVKKQHWKPILVELARLASADIVLNPT